MKYCVGADIGGTTIKLGIIDEEGALISKWEIPTRKGENGLLFMKDIADEIRKAFAEKDEARFASWAEVIFDQALLADQGTLKDPAGFVKRLNALLVG